MIRPGETRKRTYVYLRPGAPWPNAWSLSQAGLDLDLRSKSSRDRAASPRLFGQLLQLGVVEPRRDDSHIERDGSDREPLADFLDGALRVSFDARVLQSVLLERAAQRHRVARCLRGSEKL